MATVIHLVAQRNMNVTHRPMLVFCPFLTFHHVAMHLGNHVVGVYNVVMGVYRELGLRANSEQEPHGNNGTHIEDMKDPVEVCLPGSDCLLITLRMEKLRHRIPLAVFDGLPLNLCHSPVIVGGSFSGRFEMPTGGPTHVVN